MAIVPIDPSGAANPSPYFVGLNTFYREVFTQAMTELWAARLARFVGGKSKVEGFGWTDPLKRARKWVGPRNADQPAPRTYFVQPVPYEKTVEIDVFDFGDDFFGLYADLFQNAAQMLAKEVDYLLRDLILNQGGQTGAAQVGTDGLNHWHAAHPVNYYDTAFGTFPNDYRGGIVINAVTVGGSLSMLNYVNVKQDMEIRKSSHGEVMGIIARKLAHGSLLTSTAQQLINGTFLGLKSFYGQTDNVGAADNTMKGSVDLELIQDFGSSLDWLLYDDRKGKPFTMVHRELGQWGEQRDPNSQPVFNEHKMVAGGWSRLAPAWGLPQLSSISGPTAGV